MRSGVVASRHSQRMSAGGDYRVFDSEADPWRDEDSGPQDETSRLLKKAHLRTPILRMGTRALARRCDVRVSTPRTCTHPADGYPARRLASGPF